MHAIVSQQFALGRLARCPQLFLHLSVGVAKCFLLLAKERITHTQKNEPKKADRAEEREREGREKQGGRGARVNVVRTEFMTTSLQRAWRALLFWSLNVLHQLRLRSTPRHAK